MVGFVEHIPTSLEPTPVPTLGRRAWHAPRPTAASRLEVVTAVRNWMPYPLTPGLLAIDLVVAQLETGDDAAAAAQLRNAQVRAALKGLIRDALGSGDLTDQPEYLRSLTITRLLGSDLARLAPLAHGAGDPELERLFADLDLDQRLLQRGANSGVQTLLSDEVARNGTGSLMGGELPPTRIDAAPIDLAVVPPRVFAWDGPESHELRLVSTVGADSVRLLAPAPDGADPTEFVAFVQVAGTVAEAGLAFDRDNKRFGAQVPVPASDFGGPRASFHFGIRHRSAPAEWALARALTGEAAATRFMVEAWVRYRLGAACLAVKHAGAEEPIRRWVRESIEQIARPAWSVLDLARDDLRYTPSGLVAGGEDLRSRNRSLWADVDSYLGDAAQWDPKPVLTGPFRPLLAEVLFVLPTIKSSQAGVR